MSPMIPQSEGAEPEPKPTTAAPTLSVIREIAVAELQAGDLLSEKNATVDRTIDNGGRVIILLDNGSWEEWRDDKVVMAQRPSWDTLSIEFFRAMKRQFEPAHSLTRGDVQVVWDMIVSSMGPQSNPTTAKAEAETRLDLALNVLLTGHAAP